MVRYLSNPILSDAPHVDAGHAGQVVAHDPVDGVLVPDLIGHGTERVAQGVEGGRGWFDGLSDLVELAGYGVDPDRLFDRAVFGPVDLEPHPGITVCGREGPPLRSQVWGDGSCRLWPERALAGHAGLG